MQQQQSRINIDRPNQYYGDCCKWVQWLPILVGKSNNCTDHCPLETHKSLVVKYSLSIDKIKIRPYTQGDRGIIFIVVAHVHVLHKGRERPKHSLSRLSSVQSIVEHYTDKPRDRSFVPQNGFAPVLPSGLVADSIVVEVNSNIINIGPSRL